MWLLLASMLGASPLPLGDRDLFGASVASIDDLDGGGMRDLAIGDPAAGNTVRARGSVWLVSSETGRCLRSLVSDAFGPGFGWTLANVGDVDGDGASDLAVGTLGDASGGATVLSCRTGRSLHAIATDGGGLWNGWHSFGAGPALCGVGDWNGDGCADFAVGSPRHSEGAIDRGRVDVISGKDGVLLHRFVGERAHAGFGISLCAIDDLDGDGCNELAAGSVARNDEKPPTSAREDGAVHIYGSSKGALIATLRSRSPVFGLSLVKAGDLDGDRRGDLWIGEPFASASSLAPGLQAWASKTWSSLVRAEPSVAADDYAYRRFATALVPLDDLDGDGRGEVLATNPQPWGSEVFVLSASGKTLRRFGVDAPANDVSSLGVCATDAGDLDGDGARDVFLGGVTVRGAATGMVSAWSPKKSARIRDFTRASIQLAPAERGAVPPK